MKINEDRLPIPYILGVEKDQPAYPDASHIIYNEVKMCVTSPDRYNGSFTLHALKTYRFPESTEEQLVVSLNEAVKLGLLEQTNQEEGKEAYKILINPFDA